MENNMKFEDWLNEDPCCKVSWHETEYMDTKSKQPVKLRTVFIKHKVEYTDLGCIKCYPASLSQTELFIIYDESLANQIHNFQLKCFDSLVQAKVEEKIWLIKSSLKNSPNLELLIKKKIESLQKDVNKDHELDILEGRFFAYGGSVCKVLNEHFNWSKNTKGQLIIETDIGQSFIETAANLKFIEYLEDYRQFEGYDQDNLDKTALDYLNGPEQDRFKVWNRVLHLANIRKGSSLSEYSAFMWWLNKKGYFKKGTTEPMFLEIGTKLLKIDITGQDTNSARWAKIYDFDFLPQFTELKY